MILDSFIPKVAPVDIEDKIGAVRYYVKQFLMRSTQMFRYPTIPDSIPVRDLELMLQVNGFAIFTKISKNEKGVGVVDLENGVPYAFFGGLGGKLNEYYNPTKATVANPYLNFSGELDDGVNCVIVRNDSLYQGLLPIFNRYATLISENDITIRIAEINARLVSILEADNDTAKNAAVQFLKDIEEGKLGTVTTRAFYEGLKAIPYASAGSTNNITQLIELQQYLKAGVFNDIGLNANYNMKREAINSTEAQMGTDALLPFTDNMLHERKTGYKRVKDVLGIDIECEFNSAWEDRHNIADATIEAINGAQGETLDVPEETGGEENADQAENNTD